MGFSGVEISIQGDDPVAIAATANELHAALQEVDGVANLKSELTTVVPQQLDIQADPAKMAALGLTAEQMQQLTQEYYLLDDRRRSIRPRGQDRRLQLLSLHEQRGRRVDRRRAGQHATGLAGRPVSLAK